MSRHFAPHILSRMILSLQLILPTQLSYFFLSYTFSNIKNPKDIYGHTYINIDLSKQIKEEYYINLEIKKNGEKVGFAKAYVNLQANVTTIKSKLQQKQKQIQLSSSIKPFQNLTTCQLKRKQYQYMSFLWGIRHYSSQTSAIQPQTIPFIILTRSIFIILLGLLGIITQILGRFQPLTLIISFILLKWRNYVILKIQVFILLWMTIAGIVLDAIWLVFSSRNVSQINYLKIKQAMWVTYGLILVKLMFLAYLIIVEGIMSGGNQKNRWVQDKNNSVYDVNDNIRKK